MYYIIPVICLVVVCILKRTEVESVLKKKKIDVAPKISPFSDSDKCSKKVKTTKLKNEQCLTKDVLFGTLFSIHSV